MKFLKKLLIGAFVLSLAFILLIWGIAAYTENKEQEHYAVGMELYKLGKIAFSDTKFIWQRYGSLAGTMLVSGKVYNRSDKTIEEFRFNLKMIDADQDMAFSEGYISVNKDIPPNQYRAFSSTCYGLNKGEKENSYVDWKVSQIKVELD